MKPKKTLLQIVVLMLVGSALTAWASQPAFQEIKLRDGTTLRGVIRQTVASLYLVQTDQDLYELTAEEIASVDGKPGVPPQKGHRPLFSTMHRVQLSADGLVTMWSAEEITNDSDRILTYAMYGAREHELPFMRTMQAFDQYGNQLNVRIEPRAGTGIYNVFVDLVVPILPGETMRGSLRYVFPDQIICEGGTCVNRFSGNFPDDRLLTRRVELPVGATLLKATPEPNLQFEHLGQTVIVWRRYYPAGVESPLVVEYKPARR